MFDWDEANEGHIWERHGVSVREAEDAVLDPRAVFIGTPRSVEARSSLIGQTEQGRLLRIFYTLRSRLTRVVTARDANEWERKLYRKRRK
ncbi:MAG: BrnT family toxin [Tepidiformaceae bacterium]